MSELERSSPPLEQLIELSEALRKTVVPYEEVIKINSNKTRLHEFDKLFAAVELRRKEFPVECVQISGAVLVLLTASQQL